MNFEKMQSLLKTNTHPSRYKRGLIYHNSQLVDHVGFNINNNILTFEGLVESEFSNDVYTASFNINIEKNTIAGGGCTCQDYLSKSGINKLFICKHIVAISIKGIQTLKKDYAQGLITKITSKKNDEAKVFSSVSKEFLYFFKDKKKEKINLDVNITISPDGVVLVDFKLGTDQLYVMKNLKEFTDARLNNTKLEYGKNFVLDFNNHYFTTDDENIVEFIEEYSSINNINTSSRNNSKHLKLSENNLKRFLSTLYNKDFQLNYMDNVFYPKIIKEQLPLNLNFTKSDSKIILSCDTDLPLPLNQKGDIVLFNGDLYILSNSNGINYKKIYTYLNKSNKLEFEYEDTQLVLGNILPQVEALSTNIVLDNKIKENTVSEFDTKYYFDLKGSTIVCNVDFKYKNNNGEKFILRNTSKESSIINELTNLNFVEQKDYYKFNGNDNDLYNFLDSGITHLKTQGEVYYSDKFRQRKIYNSSNINAAISTGLNGYLEFEFNISDIEENDYKHILSALKTKSKFYKLKNGNFINLSDNKTKNFLELIDNLDLINISNNKIHNSKALYINEFIDENDMDFINGKEYVTNISQRFKNVQETKYKIPENLVDVLRDYQVDGFNWLNTLSCYEFGGILADEMGLGKTLQAISFLSSNRNKKTLIVTPTSLIYNWKNEFETFSPEIKVALIHGSKKEREIYINDINKYDVLITTYGTLRNDLDLYENICFDFCIIDEAQNIKNPYALSTEAVKMVNAKVRFALTGTPIENNLLELWSIFDFIMPGYLYSKNKFQDLFVTNNDNTVNLKKLIKPFILRRNKKDVMLELPDKIEKKFFVELNNNQKNIYMSYIDEINANMKNMEIKKDKFTILSYLTKLRQLCLDPSLIIDNYKGGSSKFDTCLEILKDGLENNHKILLFSQFTSALKNIGAYLEENGISYFYLDGQTPARDRLDIVDKFNDSDTTKVFLISLKAGGTGLNLTSADIVIHFDPWWNPSVESQASDRAHRFGQKNVVEVIKLIAKGTIEEKIIALQDSKKELIDNFINGDLSSAGTLKSLSDKEILDLFS